MVNLLVIDNPKEKAINTLKFLPLILIVGDIFFPMVMSVAISLHLLLLNNSHLEFPLMLLGFCLTMWKLHIWCQILEELEVYV